MSGVKFVRTGYLKVRATGEDGGFINSQSVESLLMLAILEKMEEIRWGIVDVKDAIRRESNHG